MSSRTMYERNLRSLAASEVPTTTELLQQQEKVKMEDDEPVDPLPAIRKGCISTCPKPLANYEACKERIQGKPGVSCEIWYYELHHCVDKCVAPKIFAQTKE